MANALFYRLTAVLLTFSVVLLAGCAGTSQPSRFYLLSTLPEADAASYAAADEHGVALGIGPVGVAQHLDRPQIIRRESRNKLELSEFDRWAEPVQANLTRVLALNLAHLVSTQRIYIHPWPRATKVDYQIVVYVWRFDADEQGQVVLRAHWMVQSADGKTVYVQRIADITEKVPPGDYEAMAEAQSRALGELSRQIAEVISSRKR